MDFFTAGSMNEPKFSMDHVKELANIAANSYLSDGIDPTLSLVKFAQSDELTPHQVGVLAGEINKAIHQVKYASEEDKYHAANFPLADAAKAVGQLQMDGGTEKVSCSMPEPRFEQKLPDMHAMFGVEPEVMDKKASLKHEMKVAQEATGFVGQKVQDQLILSKYAAEGAERTLIKSLRQEILKTADDQKSRLKTLGYLNHFCKCAGMHEVAKPVLAKVAKVLAHEGLLTKRDGELAAGYFLDKTADEKAPQELISSNLEARVINGKHPLYITLKTFRDSNAALELNKERHQLIQDQSSILGQKVRAL